MVGIDRAFGSQVGGGLDEQGPIEHHGLEGGVAGSDPHRRPGGGPDDQLARRSLAAPVVDVALRAPIEGPQDDQATGWVVGADLHVAALTNPLQREGRLPGATVIEPESRARATRQRPNGQVGAIDPVEIGRDLTGIMAADFFAARREQRQHRQPPGLGQPS